MVNCNNCGVELEDHMNFCPLCGVPVINEDTEKRARLVQEKQDGTRKLQHEIKMLNKSQKTKFFWEVISIILASGMLSTLVLNLIIDGYITWSIYVLIGGMTIFLYVTILSFVNKNFWILSPAVFLTTALSLLVLDLINQQIAWSVQMALPLLLTGWVLLLIVIGVFRYTREKGFNVIAYIFLVLAIFSLAVEGIISLYLNKSIQINWSAIVFFSTLPVAAILLYIHFKLRKGTDLRKFFHI